MTSANTFHGKQIIPPSLIDPFQQFNQAAIKMKTTPDIVASMSNRLNNLCNETYSIVPDNYNPLKPDYKVVKPSVDEKVIYESLKFSEIPKEKMTLSEKAIFEKFENRN